MLFVSVAKILDIDTSIPVGIMSLASALLNRDLILEARTIQRLLGKDDVKIDEIMKAIIG